MQKATCQWKKLRGGGLAGFQHKSIYRSQKLRTDMGSMQQVLFRFQLQPFVINWLLSSTANQGTALINGHTHRWTDTPRNTTINRLCHSGSVCVFVCARACVYTHKPAQVQNHSNVFDQCPLGLRAGSALFHAL